MIAALLCNGPSRFSYFNSEENYSVVAGCNVPWTNVDWTVILDEEVVQKWGDQPNLITVPAYFSKHAWMETDAIRKRPQFEKYFLGLVYPGKEFDTSGHVATSVLIDKGYKEIHVYGADSQWHDTLESASHAMFTNHPDPDSNSHIQGWRNRWKKIQKSNPDVKIVFKRNNV
jgi:hypothetical protein